jgi:hypothetical protein
VGGGPESTGKNSKPELPVPSALSGAQLDKTFPLRIYCVWVIWSGQWLSTVHRLLLHILCFQWYLS